MPYAIIRHGKGWRVVEKAGGKRPGHAFSKRPQSEAKAAAQLRAIHANSKGD